MTTSNIFTIPSISSTSNDSWNTYYNKNLNFNAFSYPKGKEGKVLKLSKHFMTLFDLKGEEGEYVSKYFSAAVFNLVNQEQYNALFTMDKDYCYSYLLSILKTYSYKSIKSSFNLEEDFKYFKNKSIPVSLRAETLARKYDYKIFAPCADGVSITVDFTTEEYHKFNSTFRFLAFESMDHNTLEVMFKSFCFKVFSSHYRFLSNVEDTYFSNYLLALAHFCYVYEISTKKIFKVTKYLVPAYIDSISTIVTEKRNSFNVLFNADPGNEIVSSFNRGYDVDYHIYAHNGKDEICRPVLAMVSCPTWCTSYGKYSDQQFHILLDSNLKPSVAIRWESSSIAVAEIQGRANDLTLSSKEHSLLLSRLDYFSFLEREAIIRHLNSVSLASIHEEHELKYTSEECVSYLNSMSNLIESNPQFTLEEVIFADDYTDSTIKKDHTSYFFNS